MNDWELQGIIRIGNIQLGKAQITDMVGEVELLRDAVLTLTKMLTDLDVEIPQDIQTLKKYIKKKIRD